jgi:GAF domain-containing protein
MSSADQASPTSLAWSSPIMSHDDEVLGTFGVYYREVRHPGPGEIHLIDYASRIAGLAIERDRSQTAVTTAFDRIKESKAELRQSSSGTRHAENAGWFVGGPGQNIREN